MSDNDDFINIDPVFDRASLTTAANWFIENNDVQQNEDIAEVLNDFLEYEDLGLQCYGESKKIAAAPSQTQPDVNNVQLFNFKAFLSVCARIFICCMWFGRGGVSSFPIWKIVVVVGGTFICIVS